MLLWMAAPTGVFQFWRMIERRLHSSRLGTSSSFALCLLASAMLSQLTMIIDLALRAYNEVSSTSTTLLHFQKADFSKVLLTRIQVFSWGTSVIWLHGGGVSRPPGRDKDISHSQPSYYVFGNNHGRLMWSCEENESWEMVTASQKFTKYLYAAERVVTSSDYNPLMCMVHTNCEHNTDDWLWCWSHKTW